MKLKDENTKAMESIRQREESTAEKSEKPGIARTKKPQLHPVLDDTARLINCYQGYH
jgi:hypothetical protein